MENEDEITETYIYLVQTRQIRHGFLVSLWKSQAQENLSDQEILINDAILRLKLRFVWRWNPVAVSGQNKLLL